MKYLLSILILFTLNVFAGTNLQPISYDKAKECIGKGKPTFLIFGSTYCHSCILMRETLSEIKEENEDYNIKYINIDYDRSVIKKFKIRAIPLQIIYDGNGTEVYENLGLLKEDELRELFQEYEF